MDSLTHLVAGALTPVVFRNTPKRAAVLGFAIAIGELPDMDILFGIAPEALLTLHRGITHALLWQPVMALAVTVPFFIWMHGRKAVPAIVGGAESLARRPISSSGVPGFGSMYLMALVGLYTHIYLDCMTTFGTQILLPFSEARIGVPAMFIVDLLLTLPALFLMFTAWRCEPDIVPYSFANGKRPAQCSGVAVFSGRARRIARIGLVWMLLYPLAAWGVNGLATRLLNPEPAAQGKLRLLPDPLAPFVWKAIMDEGDSYSMRTMNLLYPGRKGRTESYDKVDPVLYATLKKQHPLFAQFAEFCCFMVQIERSVSPSVQSNYARPVQEYIFVDMRYLISLDSAARLLNRTDPNFILEARVNDSGALVAYRFLQRGNDADKRWEELP